MPIAAKTSAAMACAIIFCSICRNPSSMPSRPFENGSKRKSAKASCMFCAARRPNSLIWSVTSSVFSSWASSPAIVRSASSSLISPPITPRRRVSTFCWYSSSALLASLQVDRCTSAIACISCCCSCIARCCSSNADTVSSAARASSSCAPVAPSSANLNSVASAVDMPTVAACSCRAAIWLVIASVTSLVASEAFPVAAAVPSNPRCI